MYPLQPVPTNLPKQLVLNLNELVLELEQDFHELSPGTNFFSFQSSNLVIAMQQLVLCSLPDADGEHVVLYNKFVAWLGSHGVEHGRAEEFVNHYISRIWSLLAAQLSKEHVNQLEAVLARYVLGEYKYHIARLNLKYSVL